MMVYRILKPLMTQGQRPKRTLGWREDCLTLKTAEGIAIAIEWSNQVWQVDHTRVDVLVVDQLGKVLSLDGKALASTLKDAHGAQQDFVSVVSACVQQCDWVIGQLSFHNGQSSEITSVRQLLQQLDATGV